MSVAAAAAGKVTSFNRRGFPRDAYLSPNREDAVVQAYYILTLGTD